MAAADRDGRPGGMLLLLKRILVVIIVSLGVGALAFAAIYRAPNDGEPFVVAEIPPPAPMAAEADQGQVVMRESLRPEDVAITSEGLSSAQPGGEGGVINPDDVEIIDPASLPDLMVPDTTLRGSQPFPSGEIRLARAPFEGFTEAGEFGPLPRISPNGRKPASVYARPYERVDARDAPVRIAILISGLGISSSGTRKAIESLPGEVTLAFAPYGEELQSWVNRARARGHEIMLQVPMEPFDYPDNDPGPHTLLTNLKSQENINRLNWLLSRFGGYFGVTNYMGAKFTADDKALAPVMSVLARRGLSFLDSGGSPRSRALPVAVARDIDAKRADVIIDAGQSLEAIEVALRRLETIAKERGSAIGVGTALPVTVKSISEWADSLAARGIALTPVSALLNPAEG